MKDRTLSIGRMPHLEKPGVGTGKAGMCRPKAEKGFHMPAFTLQDIMEVPPGEMKTGMDTYRLAMSHDSEGWHICRPMPDGFGHCRESKSGPLPGAAYNMPCRCAGNGYLKTDKEE